MSRVRTIIKLEFSDDNRLHVYPLGGKQHCEYETDASQPVRRDISLPLRIIKIDDIARRGRHEDQYPVNDRHSDDLEALGSNRPVVQPDSATAMIKEC